MSKEKIIKRLRKARVWVSFLLGAGEITEELAWSFAPNQGIFPVIQSSGSFGVFVSKFLNTNRVALPFLALQGIAYLSDAILLFILAALENSDTQVAVPSSENSDQIISSVSAQSAPMPSTLDKSGKPASPALENSGMSDPGVLLKSLQSTPIVTEKMGQIVPAAVGKPKTSLSSAGLEKTKTLLNYNKRLMKGFVSLMGAFLIAALMTAIFIATVKVLVIVYCVQSAVEMSLIGHKIGQSMQRFFASRKAIKHTEKTKNINNLQLHKQHHLEAQKNIAKQTTKFGFAALIVGLTVVSFLPIPILAQAAQVGLALIAIGFIIYFGIDRYRKYKALQVKAELAATIPDSKQQDPPNKDQTPKPELESSKESALDTKKDDVKEPLLPPTIHGESCIESLRAGRKVVTEKTLESCVRDDKNISITALSVSDSIDDNNALINAVAPQLTDINSKELMCTNDLQVNDSVPDLLNHNSELSNHSVVNDDAYEEIYFEKCRQSKFNSQQYKEVLRKVKEQIRDAETQACQPIETSISTIRTSAAAAA